MSIDELGMSLLAKQDKRREESIRRDRKFHKRARRTQLFGAATNIAINIGNKVLAQKAEDFMGNEAAMASKAKYKQAVEAAALVKKQRELMIESGIDNPTAFRYNQLEAEVKADLKERLGKTWDNVIPPKIVEGMNERAQKWGTDFNNRNKLANSLPEYEDWEAKSISRYRPAGSIGDWVGRVFTGETGKQKQEMRAADLRRDMEGFEEKYGALYRSVARESGPAFAARMTESFQGRHKPQVLNYKEVNGTWYAISIDENGERTLSAVEGLPENLTAAQEKAQVARQIRDHWTEGASNNLSEKEILSSLNPFLLVAGRADKDVLVTEAYDNLKDSTNLPKALGGVDAIEKVIDSQFQTIAEDGEEATAMLRRSLKSAGFEGEEIDKQVDLLRGFAQEGKVGARNAFKNIAVMRAIREYENRGLLGNEIITITDTIAEMSKDLRWHGMDQGWKGIFSGDMAIYLPYVEGGGTWDSLNMDRLKNNEAFDARAGELQELTGDALSGFIEEFEQKSKSESFPPEKLYAELEQLSHDARKNGYLGFKFPIVAKEWRAKEKKRLGKEEAGKEEKRLEGEAAATKAQEKEKVYATGDANTVAAAQFLHPNITPREALDKYGAVRKSGALRRKLYLVLAAPGIGSNIQFTPFTDEDSLISKTVRNAKVWVAEGRLSSQAVDALTEELSAPEGYAALKSFAAELLGGGIGSRSTRVNKYAAYFADNPQELALAKKLDFDMNAYISVKYAEYLDKPDKEGG
jgi:hypothetical protein